jgi:hypothetical protein
MPQSHRGMGGNVNLNSPRRHCLFFSFVIPRDLLLSPPPVLFVCHPAEIRRRICRYLFLSPTQRNRHFDRRRRTLTPQWRDPRISPLSLPLPLPLPSQLQLQLHVLLLPLWFVIPQGSAAAFAVACPSPTQRNRHLDRRRRTLTPQWRDPRILPLSLQLHVLLFALWFVNPQESAAAFAVTCSFPPIQRNRHLDRRWRILPPQWRDPRISPLPLQLPVLLVCHPAGICRCSRGRAE